MSNKKYDAVVANPWKIIVALVIVMTAILSLSNQPAAMAKKAKENVFLPAIFSPHLPGQSGTIAYTVNSGAEREIYTMYANRTGRVRLTENEAVDDMPAWSADGSLIVFTSDRRDPASEHYEIYTMKRDGSDVKRLTNAKWDDNSPSFSPSGDKIVFASDRNGVFQIFVMNSDGTEQQALTNEDSQSGFPDWSADGSKIVYATSETGGIEIYSMNADGSGKQRLTDGGGPDFSPAWSPDGKQIVFTSLRDGDRRIYVMNADGSGQKKLTGFYSDWADWSPDGVRIVFMRREEATSGAATSSTAPEFIEGQRVDAHRFFAHSEAAEESDSDLYTIRPDGSDMRPFTQSPWKREDRPNWGP